MPLAAAADGAVISLLFRKVPKASGRFMVKRWSAGGGGWDEWKGSVPDGRLVAVQRGGDWIYLLFAHATDP